MELFKGKKKTNTAAAHDTDYHDFIPFYCHMSPDTLLTKNGEAVQILKINANSEGLNYESGDEDGTSLRDILRQALLRSIQTGDYSVWIHTLRKRVPVELNAKASGSFSRYVEERWQEKNNFRYSYYNETYITILRDSQPAPMLDKSGMKHVMFTRSNRDWRNHYIDHSAQELHALTHRIIEEISPHYQVQRLGVYEELPEELAGQSVYYSEPLRFLSHLVTFSDRPMPLPQSDLSAAMLTHKLTFGYNAIETRQSIKDRRFGALLTLKNYVEIPTSGVDRILQAPVELIISESFHFVKNQTALKEFKEQQKLFDYSGDEYALEASGLRFVLEHEQGRETDYVRGQTSIAIIVDDYKKLDSEIDRVHQGFSDLGLIAVREDIKLEEAFWAQMPGNFEFLRRQSILPSTLIGGFSRLNLFPSGMAKGNHWGEALAVVPTIADAPYFFNIHRQDNGHCLLIDYDDFQDNLSGVLLNYILTTSCKFDARLYSFDRDRATQLTLRMLDGEYHTLAGSKDMRGCSTLALNPFSLEDTPRNRGFLIAWLGLLLHDAGEHTSHALQQSLERLYALDKTERHLARYADILREHAPELSATLSAYYGTGIYRGVFDARDETLNLKTSAIHGFDMGSAAHLPNKTALFAYLMHRIILALDGRPTVIALHEGWDLLDNAFFAPRLASLFDMFTQNNVSVIVHSRHPTQHLQSQCHAALMQACATHLILPSDADIYEAPTSWNLHFSDLKLLGRMERSRNEFLVKQGTQSAALRLSLTKMDDIRAVFSNDAKTLMSLGGPIAKLPHGY